MASSQTSSGFSLRSFALILHILLETPASLNFIFRPSFTLKTPSPAAHPIIRQYGLLLAVVNGILGIVLLDHYQDMPVVSSLASTLGGNFTLGTTQHRDKLLGRICFVLAFYHIGPLIRAFNSIISSGAVNAYGGPVVVAGVHAAVGAVLLGAFFSS